MYCARTQMTIAACVLAATLGVGGFVSSAHADCRADFNQDEQLSAQDIFDFLNAWFANDPRADFDLSGTLSAQDIFDFLNAWFAGCGPSLKISPTTGGIGSVITVRVVFDPTNLFAIDASTTMTWDGQFLPLAGAPSAPFQLSFSAADVLETTDPHIAKIVLGSGSGSVPNSVLSSSSSGGLVGLLSAPGASGPITGTVALLPNAGGGTWYRIDYPDGVGGLASPLFGGTLTQLDAYALSLDPDPANPSQEELQFAASDFHMGVELSAENNADAASTAPSTRTVSLVSFRSDGTEIMRVTGVVLTRQTIVTGQPITYRSSPAQPILFVDTAPTSGPLTGVTVVTVEDGGRVIASP